MNHPLTARFFGTHALRPTSSLKGDHLEADAEAHRAMAGVVLMGALVGLIVGVLFSFMIEAQGYIAVPVLRNPLLSGVAGLVFGTFLGLFIGSILGAHESPYQNDLNS